MVLKILLIISSVQISLNIAQNVYDGFVSQYNEPRLRNWNGMWFSAPAPEPAPTYSTLYDPFQQYLSKQSPSSLYPNQPVEYYNSNARDNSPSDSFRASLQPISNNNELNYDYDSHLDSKSYLNDEAVYSDNINPINRLTYEEQLSPIENINYNPNIQGFRALFPEPRNQFMQDPIVQSYDNTFSFSGESNYNTRNARKLDYSNNDYPYVSDAYDARSYDNNLYSNSLEGEEFNFKQNPSENSPSYGYNNNGTYSWPINYPDCGKDSQSPIDIVKNKTKGLITTYLKLINYSKPPKSMTITNTGHTLELTMEYSSSRPYVTGGFARSKRYILHNVHFHWGSDSSKGSEHTRSGESTAMEMHLVHYNSRYGSLENALTKSDGLLVLAYFNLFTMFQNRGMDAIVRDINKVIQPGQKTPIRSFPLTELIRDFETYYFAYKGSLTTPPCYETVSWIISPLDFRLKEYHLTEFRKLMSSEGGPLVNNFRPIQPLNGRTVYFSKQ